MSGAVKRGKDRGFVLVNALVLVAAFAAAAIWLLGRAEQGRLRQAEAQGAGQLRLYLDGFEALALTLLRRDQRGGPVDGPGDLWALAVYDAERPVTLDRGQGTGRITDLQGRFNINWLANPGDTAAQESFTRLTQSLGLNDSAARAITDFLQPGGPDNAQTYARLRPGVAPVGGPVLLIDQLAAIPGLRPRDLERLRPHIAALPSDATLNLNTVSPRVLASLIPGATSAALSQALRDRDRNPFTSLDDFLARAAAALPGGTLSEEDQPRFHIGSDWFQADIAVALEGRILTRQTIIERRALPLGPQVAYRLENRRE